MVTQNQKAGILTRLVNSASECAGVQGEARGREERGWVTFDVKNEVGIIIAFFLSRIFTEAILRIAWPLRLKMPWV